MKLFHNKKHEVSRRDFLKMMGAAGMATGLAACGVQNRKSDATSETSEPQKGQMTYRVNPSTGDRVSLLGFGMMRLPSVSGKSAREQGDEIDQEQVNRLVDYAIEHGVNYFDTSPAYCKGQSEHATGIALSRHPRDKYFIATKLSNFSPESQSRQSSIDMYRNSLKELQTDHIDYMLLHGIGMGDNGMEEFENRYMKNGILDFLLNERKEGRIRNLGFSYHGDIKVFDYLLSRHDEYKWDFAQIQLNYLDWEWADEINDSNTDAKYLYDELQKRNIPAVIMEPLLGGRLANVPDPVVAEMKQRRPESSVASWAFRYAGTPEKVLTVLSGMTYMEHLRENIRTYAPLEPITKEENEFLLKIAEDIYNQKNIPCNECNYCMPCPYGINIPSVFVHYNKMIREGNMPSNKQNPEYRKQRKAFLVGYDRSVPRLRQADHCIGCGQCVPHCPQRIDIPKEMRRIDTMVENLKRDGKVKDLEF